MRFEELTQFPFNHWHERLAFCWYLQFTWLGFFVCKYNVNHLGIQTRVHTIDITWIGGSPQCELIQGHIDKITPLVVLDAVGERVIAADWISLRLGNLS